MMRTCGHCGQFLTASDLCRDASKEVEASRKASHIDGLHFRCYECGHCDRDNLFVDVYPLENESDAAFHRRVDELQRVVHQLRPNGVEVNLAERSFARPYA